MRRPTVIMHMTASFPASTLFCDCAVALPCIQEFMRSRGPVCIHTRGQGPRLVGPYLSHYKTKKLTADVQGLSLFSSDQG